MDRTVNVVEGWKTREFGPVSQEIFKATGLTPEWYFGMVEERKIAKKEAIAFVFEHCLKDEFNAKWPGLSNAAQSWVNMCVNIINSTPEGDRMNWPDLDLPEPKIKTVDMAQELSREADEIVARLEHKNVSATLRARELCILHPEYSIQQLMHRLTQEGFTLSRSILTAVRSQTKQALLARARVVGELGEEEADGRIAKLIDTPLTKRG